MSSWRRLTIVAVAIATTSCDSKPEQVKVTDRRPRWAIEFLDSCPVADVDTSGWKTIDSRSVSFKVPPEFTDGPGIQIDTEGVDLEFGDRTIGFCAQCAPYAATKEWLRCRELIDGHAAYIVASRDTAFGGRYFVGASFVNGPSHMVLGGLSPDMEGQQVVLAAIRTVRFKVELDDVPVEWTPSPPDTTRATPTFVDACPAPHIDTSDWNRIALASISFSVPPEYVEVIGTRIDIEPGEENAVSRSFSFGRTNIGITVEPRASLSHLTAGMNDSECREVIGGHEAQILSGRGPGDTYFVSSLWNVAPPGKRVVIGGSSTSMTEQRKLLALVRTVRFARQAK